MQQLLNISLVFYRYSIRKSFVLPDEMDDLWMASKPSVSQARCSLYPRLPLKTLAYSLTTGTQISNKKKLKTENDIKYIF